MDIQKTESSESDLYRYKLFIKDRDYSDWEIINEESSQRLKPDIQPVHNKWFNKDIILYDQPNNSYILNYSQVRSGISIAGILVLDGNRTFGRTKNKLLYKCIPDDKHLPVFIVPYDPPIHFSKVFKNKYVLFQFDKWENQHPEGKLTATIGEVDNLESFYEYQLYCKSLHISLTQFTNKTRELLQKETHENYILQILNNPQFNIQDRRNKTNAFTIDPQNSTDFDDAFSITTDKENNQMHITIYIANVFVWLETLNLWESFTNRVSTIYLPDRKRPMLPTILSDNLCSLQENKDRFAFALDLVFNDKNKLIQNSFHMVLINVSHNFRYESPELDTYQPYQSLYDFTRTQSKSISDSHDVVAYWMVKMNSICGNEMAQQFIGIFRQATFTRTINEPPFDSHLSTDTKRIITMWNNVSGQYVLYGIDLKHDIMKLSNYTHVTSPIRRLVDLLNQLWILSTFRLITEFSEQAQSFLHKWLHKIEYVNTSMRSIRKIQTDCEVLHRCISNHCILENLHIGTLFDKLQKNDGGFIYMVYLEELKLLTRLKTYIEYENYSCHSFQLFLFLDENNLKKKIRVQIKN